MTVVFFQGVVILFLIVLVFCHVGFSRKFTSSVKKKSYLNTVYIFATL